jgi:hypothetical protein
MWTRLSRRLALDGNPLRRRSDLLAGWLLPAAIAAFLVLGPVAAGVADSVAHSGITSAQQAQRTWRQFTATTTLPAAGPARPLDGSNSWTEWVPARWVVNGQPRSGLIPVASGTWAGDTVPVWLDAAGHVRLPPLSNAGVRNRVLADVGFTLAGLALLLTVAAVATWRVLHRRRLASWEDAWLAEGPYWSRHI